MHKIVDEQKILGYKEINGEQVPIYSCKTETVITNTRTGTTYESEDHCSADVADPNTDTTDSDIKRDVTIFCTTICESGCSQ